MISSELKKLNNYPEFGTAAGINAIIQFITAGNFPAGLNARQQIRYNQKFGVGSGFVSRNHNTELWYNPNANINLEVVPPNLRANRILAVYNDIRRGLGTGLNAFYHQVASLYLNISKKLTDAFLRSKGDYAIARVPQKLVNKPILSRAPNERWGVDLIDLNPFRGANQQRRFILTVVDYFSGKVFARGLTNKQNNAANPTLSTALDSICVANNTYPNILQGDNEFRPAGALGAWFQANNIQSIRTSPYYPVSNGKVERMNRELRRKIKAGFIRNNNRVWYPHLQAYVDNLNNQINSKSKLSANDLWTPGYVPPVGPVPPLVPLNENMNLQQRKQYKEAFIEDQARRTIANGRRPRVFNIGDMVRISIGSLNNGDGSRWREIKESTNGWNKTAVHYTPEVFTVVNTIPAGATIREQYVLANMAGQVLMSGAVPKRFFGNDLVFVPVINTPASLNPLTTARARWMNDF